MAGLGGNGGGGLRRITAAGAAAWAWPSIALSVSAAPAAFPRMVQAERDAGRAFLFLPVAAAAGILVYFAAWREPWLPAPLAALALFSAASFALRRRPGAGFAVCLGLAAAFAGFSAATLRTRLVAAPVLGFPRTGVLQGFVEQVDPRPGGGRLLLALYEAKGLDAAQRPARVRLTLPERPTVQAGDYVEVNARLVPPPEPSRPGGYDFAREAFFSGIGAVGSVSGPVRLAPAPLPQGYGQRFSAAVDRARNDLTSRIATSIGGAPGAVAAALVTGKRGLIPEDVNDALRGAGIYHVVSISGLHMVLAAGMVFWIVRALLALSPTAAMSWPTKKIAALAGMGAACVYNVFAGSEIATERSLIMTLVLLGAVLADRPALSMRNLAFAALAVLALEPESVLGPSFQMSFGAVAALIALFEVIRADPDGAEAGGFTPLRRARPARGPPPGLAARAGEWIRRHAGLAVLSTLVAEAATAPFGLYHFQKLTIFGVAGNALTLPLVSVVVMPAALVGILAAPFGLDAPVWRLMGFGVDGMLAVAARVAALPGAVQAFPAYGAPALLMLSGAVVSATLWRHGLRWSAVPLLCCGVALAAAARPPDITIAPDGRALALRGPDGKLAVLGRAGSFTIEQWLRADGDSRAGEDQSALRGGRCDPSGCVGRLANGQAVALVTAPLAFAEDCRRAAVVVTPLVAPAWCRPALLVDRATLRLTGALDVTALPDGGFAVDPSRPAGAERPWMRAPPPPRPTAQAEVGAKPPPKAVPADDDLDVPPAQ